MRLLLGRITLSLCCLCVLAPVAGRAADLFPPAMTRFSTPALVLESDGAMPRPAAFAGSFALEDATASTSAPTQSYWPLLYSALIPGLGETVMGYEKRGIALMAAEVVAWSGWYKYHNDGLDERAAYEHFADLHWSVDKWISDFPNICSPPPTSIDDIEQCGKDSSGSGVWPGYIPFVPKSVDKQHYYENLGKYDWYISGWSDWDPNANPYEKETDLRTQYRAMRYQSNQDLDKANAFVWVSVAARAFSLAETAILIHNRRGAEAGGGDGSPISLHARPRGRTGGEVALEVRFK